MSASKSMDSGKIHTIEFGKSITYGRHLLTQKICNFFSSVCVRGYIGLYFLLDIRTLQELWVVDSTRNLAWITVFLKIVIFLEMRKLIVIFLECAFTVTKFERTCK